MTETQQTWGRIIVNKVSGQWIYNATSSCRRDGLVNKEILVVLPVEVQKVLSSPNRLEVAVVLYFLSIVSNCIFTVWVPTAMKHIRAHNTSEIFGEKNKGLKLHSGERSSRSVH